MKNKTRPVTAQFTRAYMRSALLFAAAAVLSVASHAGGLAVFAAVTAVPSPGNISGDGGTSASYCCFNKLHFDSATVVNACSPGIVVTSFR